MIKKSHNHEEFYVENNQLYEVYNHLGRLRYRPIATVVMPDKEFLTNEDIKAINKQLAR